MSTATNQMDKWAETIWNYLRLNQPLKKCDAIFVLCSFDDRIATYAAKLFLKDYGDWLIFSGGRAHQNDVLRPTWQESEAEHFAQIARQAGVPNRSIIVEDQAANTGENITLTFKLLRTRRLHFTSLLLIQKPFMERRTYATFVKQWPEPGTEIVISSPPLSLQQYLAGARLSKESIINNMVGDLQRIREYPKLGYQIEQPIPAKVWAAWEKLVAAGYDKLLLK